MREIGGYLGLDDFKGCEYHRDVIGINNATNGVIYIAKSRDIKKMYIPHYLCDSVKSVLIKYGYEFEQYGINPDFTPDFRRRLESGESFYIANYYGQISDEKILRFKEEYGDIIVDNAHDFYRRPISGIDTLYSCRKFFGVPDGAYISTEKSLVEELELDISKDRMTHILGSYEGKNSEYYREYKETEESFDAEELKRMSRLTRNILRAIDYEKVRTTRNKNYRQLENSLGDMNMLNLKAPDGPFAYPLYLENGAEIRGKLAEKGIYTPLLWPNVVAERPKETIEHRYSRNILPIPCDQRYDRSDMEYLVEVLKCIY